MPRAWAPSPEKCTSVRAASASDPNAVWAAAATAAKSALSAVAGSRSALPARMCAFRQLSSNDCHVDDLAGCPGQVDVSEDEVRISAREFKRLFVYVQCPVCCAGDR